MDQPRAATTWPCAPAAPRPRSPTPAAAARAPRRLWRGTELPRRPRPRGRRLPLAAAAPDPGHQGTGCAPSTAHGRVGGGRQGGEPRRGGGVVVPGTRGGAGRSQRRAERGRCWGSSPLVQRLPSGLPALAQRSGGGGGAAAASVVWARGAPPQRAWRCRGCSPRGADAPTGARSWRACPSAHVPACGWSGQLPARGRASLPTYQAGTPGRVMRARPAAQPPRRLPALPLRCPTASPARGPMSSQLQTTPPPTRGPRGWRRTTHGRGRSGVAAAPSMHRPVARTATAMAGCRSSAFLVTRAPGIGRAWPNGRASFPACPPNL